MLCLTAILLVASSPLQPQHADGESYTETITAIADLDDGTYVQAQLAVSNLGFGDDKGACRLLVIPSSGAPWTHAGKVDHDEWRFRDKPVPTLVVGTCQMMAGRSLVIDFQLEGASVHIDLAARVRAVAPPGNLVGDLSGAFYTYEILVPWAAARARISLPERSAIVAEGRGYADHSRSTMMPADLAKAWVRFRGLGEKCPTLILVRTPPKGKSEGWVWTDGPAPKLLRPEVSLAMPVTLTAAALTLNITPDKKLYHHAPLEEYALAGLVRGWIGSPETTTYRATLTGVSCGPVPGILEVTTIGR